MGKDIHIVIEHREKCPSGELWNGVGYTSAPFRNYKFFEKLRENAYVLPDNISWEAKKLIRDDEELFDKCSISYNDFYKLKHAEKLYPRMFKDSYADDLRMIIGFDW